MPFVVLLIFMSAIVDSVLDVGSNEDVSTEV